MADIQGLAADLVKAILNKVYSLTVEENSLVWGFQGDLAGLNNSLQMIQSFLADAETRAVGDKSVKLWLEKLKDEAYHADDVLDEFTYEMARQKVEIRNEIRKKVRFFFSSCNPVLFRSRLAHKIKEINTSLREIRENATVLGLRVGLQAAPSQVTVTHPVTDSLLHQSEVIVGRDVDASNIVKMMLTAPGNQETLSVIPIVGRAGLGKTTLAKLIYNGDEIERNFDSKIWVCVSDDFDVKRLLKDILESLTKEKCDVEIRTEILEELRKKLAGKKYMLVLDDMWNEDTNKWDDFKNCMLRVSTVKGNNILITTRIIAVASMVGTLPMYHVEASSSEQCWSIFKEQAFADGGAQVNLELENIGRLIAEKCNGMPLAAKLAGSMMRSKKDKEEWLSILHDGVWSAFGDKHVLPIIKLSFDHLPLPSMKQCFAYCSLFSKDSILEKQQLIQLWMAQEYLQPKEGSNMVLEDIGNEYFEALLQSSLFQEIEKDDYDNITHCKMDDLVHDLAQSISKSNCFMQEYDYEKVHPRVRHLALYSSGKSIGDIQQESAERLYTLFFDKIVLVQPFLKFRCLRVLSLRGAYIIELSSSIRALVHLRYLDLSNSSIKSLPESIVELYNLQTLRLEGCENILKFPKEFKNLISLRHLHLQANNSDMIEMPNEIRWLTSLQTLSLFRVGEDNGFQIEELGYLKNLRGKLDIYGLEKVGGKKEAQKADLCGKKNIYHLTFNWDPWQQGNQSAEDVLEGLQPSPSLKGLHIKDFPGDNFPLWMMKMAGTANVEDAWLPLNNLVTVRLIYCRRCEHVPMLGQLPHLRDLELEGMDNVECLDESFYGYDCHQSGTSHSSNETKVLFPSLKRFNMRDMKKLTEWIKLPEGSGVQAFPCLYDLSIRGCPLLESVPSHFPHLQKLSYWNCSGLPLQKICSSQLPSLTKLEISEVNDITSLPDELLQNIKYLEVLKISSCDMLTSVVPYMRGCDTTSLLRSLIIISCKRLSNLPDDLNTLSSLERLVIRDCPNIKSIPSVQGLNSLVELNISLCDESTCLPSELQSCTSLNILEPINLSSDIQVFHFLSTLRFAHWATLTCLPTWLQFCTSLNTLEVEYCRNLTSFPDIQALCSLSILKISHCEKLTCLPTGLQSNTSLNILEVEYCKSLTSFPDMQSLRSLSTLKICHCEELACLSTGLQYCTSLNTLEVEYCKNLTLFPDIQALCSLSTLRIYHCEKLTCLPNGIQFPTRLVNLTIGPFSEKLNSFPGLDVVQRSHASLNEVKLYGWSMCNLIPRPLQYLSALTYLHLDSFGVTCLPKWFQYLASLEVLSLSRCEKLKSLPRIEAMQRLTKLKRMEIRNCPLLEVACKEGGPEWHKISHIEVPQY